VHGPRIPSALVGLIWRAREDLSFDVGVRYARMDSTNVQEIRAGLTLSLAPAKWTKCRKRSVQCRYASSSDSPDAACSF